jgi:hypothetical protein
VTAAKAKKKLDKAPARNRKTTNHLSRGRSWYLLFYEEGVKFNSIHNCCEGTVTNESMDLIAGQVQIGFHDLL